MIEYLNNEIVKLVEQLHANELSQNIENSF